MGSVSNIDLLNKLKNIGDKFDTRLEVFESQIAKLNKYFIGRMVDAEVKSKQQISDIKMLRESLDKLTLKYDKLEIALRNEIESNNKPNQIESNNMPMQIEINKTDDFIEIKKQFCSEKEKVIEVQADIKTVNKEINSLKQKNLSKDIIATGVPEIKNEILLESVNNILIKHDITLKESDIKKIYRLKNKNCVSISPILIEFKNDSFKSMILQKQRKNGPVLLNEVDSNILHTDLRKVYFKDRLTKENLILLRECRIFGRTNGFKYVWVQDSGTILIKQNDNTRPIEISSLQELDQLI